MSSRAKAKQSIILDIFIKNMKKLLIWTRNPSKIRRWSNHFGHVFEIVSLKDVWIDDEVEESLDDLVWNSQKKALFYAQKSGLLTFSDDTWFFIDELWWLPWVAVRRWWWEIPNEISDQDFIEFFRKKVAWLNNFSAYFKYAISVATPEWEIETIVSELHWIIDIDKLWELTPKDYGYPLSLCFVDELTGKSYSECSDEERIERDKPLIEKIKPFIEKYI